MVTILLSTKSTKKEILTFLDELKAILEKDDFNLNTDFNLISKKKNNDTLLDLEYGIDDVVERLKELEIEEYSETRIDKDDLNPPLLFIFGKNINSKQVYIKLKIKAYPLRYVLCVSFHYAEEKMFFPYA